MSQTVATPRKFQEGPGPTLVGRLLPGVNAVNGSDPPILQTSKRECICQWQFEWRWLIYGNRQCEKALNNQQMAGCKSNNKGEYCYLLLLLVVYFKIEMITSYMAIKTKNNSKRHYQMSWIGAGTSRFRRRNALNHFKQTLGTKWPPIVWTAEYRVAYQKKAY